MHCKTARRVAERRTDRERFDEEALREHLGSCHDCAAAVRAAEALAAHLDEVVQPREPRHGFEGRVLHRLDRRLVARSRPSWRWKPAWVFAAGVAVGALLVAGAPDRGSDPRRAEVQAPELAFVPVGTVVTGVEAVEVLSPNGAGGDLRPADLKPGSTVWLAREGIAEITLRDGGTVKLGEDAVVRFRENGLVLYRGAVDLDVQRGREPFIVEFPHGYVVADEAEIRVQLDQRAAKVEMVSGFAWLGNESGSIAVAGGETAEVRDSAAAPVSTT